MQQPFVVFTQKITVTFSLVSSTVTNNDLLLTSPTPLKEEPPNSLAVGGVASLMVTKGPHVGVSPLDQPLVNFGNISNSGTNHREHSNGDLELSSAGSAHRNNRYYISKTAEQSDFALHLLQQHCVLLNLIKFHENSS